MYTIALCVAKHVHTLVSQVFWLEGGDLLLLIFNFFYFYLQPAPQFPTNAPSNLPLPPLYPGGVIQLQEHMVVCTETFDEPAVGAVYISNYRIIFHGNLISVSPELVGLQHAFNCWRCLWWLFQKGCGIFDSTLPLWGTFWHILMVLPIYLVLLVKRDRFMWSSCQFWSWLEDNSVWVDKPNWKAGLAWLRRCCFWNPWQVSYCCAVSYVTSPLHPIAVYQVEHPTCLHLLGNRNEGAVGLLWLWNRHSDAHCTRVYVELAVIP